MKPSKITHSTDPDGREVVGVSLSNSPDKIACLYREDYDRIAAQYPGPWSLVNARKPRSYVRVVKNSASLYIARLVVDAVDQTGVSFDDGNPLNLRSSNLTVRRGPGGVPKLKVRKELCIPMSRGGAHV